MTPTDGLALATRGLQKRYGSTIALAGLDLSVPTGIVYGFLGPNGAGKTTTMRLLTGLIHPDAGTIEVLGLPFDRRDRRRLYEVGALIESPSFFAVSGNAFGGGGAVPPRLDSNTALVVVAAWLIGALAVAALFRERAEISG